MSASPRSVTRHYVAVGDRDVHYRRAGDGPPVVLLHESPLSSLMYEGHVEHLAARFAAIALDTPGYGNSDPLVLPAPTIGDYAEALGETLDALGIARCGLYGAHTGACIALEFAARNPGRVAALVLDGLLLPSAEERRDLLAHYCPTFEPQTDGSHLVRAWGMRRDMHLFFPWYRRTPTAMLKRPLPDASALHRGMLDYLRAGSGYHRGYDAAFSYDPSAALRSLTMPTAIVAAPTDGTFAHLARLPDDLPPGVTARPRPAEPAAALEDLVAAIASASAVAPAPSPPRQQPRAGRLTRAYVETAAGQLHLRAQSGGRGRPLVLIHGSPTSAASLDTLLLRLGRSRPVYAFDTLGNGESDKPNPLGEPPTIADLAAVLAEAVGNAGIGDLDLYGTHTGAAIAIELALRRPEGVGRLVLDGVAMFDEATVGEFLERYFVDLTPHVDGSHLLVAWGNVHDSMLWFPWYRRDPAHRFRSDLRDAAALHAHALEFLKSGSSYPLPYRAAFTYRARERLPLIVTPTLIAVAGEDPLAGFLDAAVAACPAARGTRLAGGVDGVAATIERFLDAAEAA